MLTITNLTQTYKSGKGIFNINLTVKKGEVFGFLGPNGAGKTTTIRNILGFSNADQGQVTILGKDARKQAKELQKAIGYLPGEIAFFDNMTGIEFLDFMSNMRDMKNLDKRQELIDYFEFDYKGKIKKMSKGMKQKLGIVAAFMHDPEIIILDEPTSGLDPLMQNKFMTLLENEKKAGKTIFMSSHIFEEVEKICDRAGIIKDGKLIAIEDVHSLKKMASQTFVVTGKDVSSLQSAGYELVSEGNKHTVTFNKDFKTFFKALSECDIDRFEIKQQSLEDLFMKYYGKEATHD